MAVPAVFTLTPERGPTRGDMIVEILGSGFQLPTIPVGPGPSSGELPATVSVLFNGIASPFVEVLSSSLLLVTVPAHEIGQVNITVENVDADGVVIPSETITIANAFTYEIPRLTNEYESDLVRCVRAILRLLKQQTVAKEVNRPIHTDYDDDTSDALNIVKVGAFPAITLMGPKMQENRFYSSNEQPTIEVDTDNDDVPDAFVEMRVPYVVDLAFTVVAVSDRDTELLNLMTSFVLFMHRNKYLWLERIKGRPEFGRARFEFDFSEDGEPQMPGTPNNSNIHQWSAEIVVRGFPIEELAGINTGLFPGTAVPRHAIIGEGRMAIDVNIDPTSQIGED